MRGLSFAIYLGAFVGGLAPSAEAQDAEKDTTSEPRAENPAPSPEPRLQLQLDESGVELAPTKRGSDYRQTKLRRARIGLAVSVIAFGGGLAMMGAGGANVSVEFPVCFGPCPQTPAWARKVLIVGVVFTIGGLVGMIFTGKRLAEHKAQLRWYGDAPKSPYGKPRPVQWDPTPNGLRGPGFRPH